MVKWRYKGCSRCGGTTYLEEEDNTIYEKCLMCSNRVEIGKAVRKNVNPSDTEKESAATHC